MDTVIAGKREVDDLKLTLLTWNQKIGSAFFRGKPCTLVFTEEFKDGDETERFYKVIRDGKKVATVSHLVSFKAGSVLRQTMWIESAS